MGLRKLSLNKVIKVVCTNLRVRILRTLWDLLYFLLDEFVFVLIAPLSDGDSLVTTEGRARAIWVLVHCLDSGENQQKLTPRLITYRGLGRKAAN